MSVKVRCANPQTQLTTGQPCGWTGRRNTYYETRGGRWITIFPTTRPCPHCGSRVEELPA